MAVISNIVDLISAGNVKIKDGDFLAPQTLPQGVINTYKEAGSFITSGEYLYQVKGQGTMTPGVSDVQTLTLGAATVSGNITITLNGVTFTVAVAAGDTSATVASKVSALVFTSAGYNDSASTNVVTFTATAHGIKPLGVFNGGTTGVTGTFAATTPGTNDSYAGGYNVYPCIVNGSGNVQADTTQQPVIIQTAGQVVYQGGRNHLAQKDVYLPNGVTTISGITAGQEPKEVLKAFLAFSQGQFASGVNDFHSTKGQYISN